MAYTFPGISDGNCVGIYLMSIFYVRCVAFFLTCSLAVSMGFALDDVPLDPLALVKNVEGECFVSRPGTTQLVAVAEAHAYHFGSQFRTGGSGSMALMFSAANVCEVQAGTLITPLAVARNNRAIKLHRGKIKVSVEEEFDKTITVETGGDVICNARKGAFTVDVSPTADGGENVVVTCS